MIPSAQLPSGERGHLHDVYVVDEQGIRLRYRPDDYLVIPRGTTYRLLPDEVKNEDHLVLESNVRGTLTP